MVPQIMVNRLKVPLVGPGLNIDGNHRVAKQVRTLSIAAVGPGDRRRQWDVQHSARFIEREVERPGVDPKASLPALTVPRIVSHTSGLRDRAELPQFRARAGIVTHARCRCRHQDPGGVFAPTTTTFRWMNGTELYGTTRSTSPFLPKPETGAPVAASSAKRRRPAVKMMRAGARRHQASTPHPGATGPPQNDIAPAFFSGFRLERNHTVGGRQIHRAADDDRRGLEFGPPPRPGGLGAGPLCSE